jgi:hypothetical protein
MSDNDNDVLEIKLPKKVGEELIKNLQKANGCGCGCIMGCIVQVGP